MRLAALVSSGKDSIYAMYLAAKQDHEIRYIISFVSKNPDSYMFHVPNINLVREQTKLMKIKHIEIETEGEKEKELEDIETALKKVLPEIDGIVTGAIESVYQKSRIDAIAERLGIKSTAPLWHKNSKQLLHDMLAEGFEIMIIAVAAPPLDIQWLGRIIDEQCIDELVKLNKKYGIHIIGEGGEYDTLVLDCPMFSKKLVVNRSEKTWNNKLKYGILRINKIHTQDK